MMLMLFVATNLAPIYVISNAHRARNLAARVGHFFNFLMKSFHDNFIALHKKEV